MIFVSQSGAGPIGLRVDRRALIRSKIIQCAALEAIPERNATSVCASLPRILGNLHETRNFLENLHHPICRDSLPVASDLHSWEWAIVALVALLVLFAAFGFFTRPQVDLHLLGGL